MHGTLFKRQNKNTFKLSSNQDSR